MKIDKVEGATKYYFEVDAADLVDVEVDRFNHPLGGVYFFKVEHFIKIGYSNHVVRRFVGLRRQLPFEMEALGFVKCDSKSAAMSLESRLHEQFRSLHVCGEWFRAETSLTDYIKVSALAWPTRT